MGITPDIVRLLEDDENRKIVTELRKNIKKYLVNEFQDLDDKTIELYIMGYIINAYEIQPNDFSKKLFIDSLCNNAYLAELMDDFVEKINGTKSIIGDRVRIDAIEIINQLKDYKKSDIYKELSKSNKEIAKIIKQYHGYFTITELKKLADNPPKGKFVPYIISNEELEIIECVKENNFINKLGHILYDENKGQRICCNPDISSEEDILKNLLANTGKNNPPFDIVFKDGTIVDYYRGYIRVRRYNFKHVIELVKLYYAQNFEKMKERYNKKIFITNLTNEELSYQIGKQMVVSSFISVLNILNGYEQIYTKQMIENSKKEFVKIKETVEKYDLE